VSLIFAGCSAPAAAPAAGKQADTGKVYEWVMQSTWSAGDYHQTNPTLLVDRIQKATNGRIKIDLQPAGAIVPAFEVLDSVHKGVLDAGHAWPGYWTGKDSAMGLFSSAAGGPFGMDSIDYMTWMYNYGGLDLYNELLQDKLQLNVVAMMTFPEIAEPMGWFKKEIKSWSDFSGLKFRAGGLTAEVMTEAGMTVVILPGGEIIPSGEKGVIDAAEFSDPTVDMSLGFMDVWKYYHVPGIHQPTGHMELLINKDKWNELPDDLKYIVEMVAQATTLQGWINWSDKNAGDLITLQEKHGVNIIRTPDDVLTEVLKAWDVVAAKKAGENPFFKKVLDAQKDFASTHVPHRIKAWPDYNFAAKYYWPEAFN
jgi:TRAP-type mannitol/chloroaromatic compound transport system substrate-binding protein